MRRFLVAVLGIAGCDGCGSTEVLKPVARCDDARGDVRSHPPETSTWARLSVGALLQAGAWVQTAEDAWAQIEFLDTGSTLRVEPGSLVVLEGTDDRTTGGVVSLRSGSVFANVTKGKTIRLKASDGRPFAVEPADQDVAVQLRASKNGAELAVMSGRAKVVGEDGATSELSAGLARSVENGVPVGKVVELLAAPAQQPPEPVPSGEVTVLRWTPIDGAKAYRVRVTRDGTVVSSGIVEGPQLPVGALTEGSEISWSVSGVDEAGREGRAAQSTFVVEAAIVDRLTGPNPDALVTYRKALPVITFSWAHAGPARLRVATDPQMKRLVIDETVSGGRHSTRALQAGTYHWTVTAGDQRLSATPRKMTVRRSHRGLGLPSKLQWK